MKKAVISIIVILLSIIAHSQNSISTNPDDIRKASKRVKVKYTKDPASLATKLCENYTDDNSKIVALTYWIAKNIKYDYKAYINRTFIRHTSTEILDRKLALCSEYTHLFNEMCEAVGVSSLTVDGYVKKFDFTKEDNFYRADHSWSAVKIDNKWKLMDITWASCSIVLKKQYLAKLLLFLFNKHYYPKFKAVKNYNQYWIDLSPEQIIETHFPELEIFQLLEEPISIDAFINDTILSNLLITDSLLQSNIHSKIDKYDARSEQHKLLKTAINSHEDNNYNHTNYAFNFYQIAKNTFYDNYDFNERVINGGEYINKKISYYCKNSDSIASLAINGNEIEFNVYNNRSMKWKDDLKSSNKSHLKGIKEIEKLNKNQLRIINTTKRKNKSINRYAKSSSKRSKKVKVLNVNRPKELDINDAIYADLLLSKVDSLLNLNSELITKKDALMNIYSDSVQKLLIKTKQNISETRAKTIKKHKKYVFTKKMKMPWIYFNYSSIDKLWLANSICKMDSINYYHITENLGEINNNQIDALSLMKAIIKNNKQILKHIKNIKKHSFKDQQENNTYNSVASLYHSQCDNYKKQVQSYLSNQNMIKFYTKQEIKGVATIKKLIKKDDKLENVRHKMYSTYRKSIKNVENSLMKKIQKEMDYFDKNGGYHKKENLAKK